MATAPRAHADLEDLIIQPIVDAIAQAVNLVDPSLANMLDPGLDVSSLVAPALAAAADTAAPVSATIPLSVNDVTEPVVDLSVSGGSDIPVLVDTGSTGLVVPWYDLGLQDLGFPTGINIGSYSGGLDYLYLTLPATVSFTETNGETVTTAQTPVDAELLAWPTSAGDPTSFESFLAPAGAAGVLGIGPDAGGPGPSSVISALPGDLNDGALINESGGYLEFGPNPLTPDVSLAGAPILNSTLDVSVNGGTPEPVTADIDSGGVYGTIPSSVDPGAQVGQPLPAGTLITVYNTDGQELYSYTTGATSNSLTNGPTVTSGDTMDTGYIPFQQQPVYVSNSPTGVGTTIFDR